MRHPVQVGSGFIAGQRMLDPIIRCFRANTVRPYGFTIKRANNKHLFIRPGETCGTLYHIFRIFGFFLKIFLDRSPSVWYNIKNLPKKENGNETDDARKPEPSAAACCRILSARTRGSRVFPCARGKPRMLSICAFFRPLLPHPCADCVSLCVRLP